MTKADQVHLQMMTELLDHQRKLRRIELETAETKLATAKLEREVQSTILDLTKLGSMVKVGGPLS